MKENELLLKRNLRDEVMNDERLEVLDSVKTIAYLSNSKYSTVEQVADYYEVGTEAIKSISKRNKEELEQNGMKYYKKSEILLMVQCEDMDFKKQIPNRGTSLFNKKTILLIGLLLEGSPIADKIKQKLGIYVPRKELNFRNNLDKNLNYLKEEYIKRRKEIYYNQEPNLKMFEYETQKYFGDNRVDFYFPYMNLVVEYDERYHEDIKQQRLDKRREIELLFELEKEFYDYDDNYCGYEEVNNVKIWSFVDQPSFFNAVEEKDFYCCDRGKELNKNKNREDYFCDECGVFDISKLQSMGKIIRIKENEEEIGLMKIISYIMSEIKGF